MKSKTEIYRKCIGGFIALYLIVFIGLQDLKGQSNVKFFTGIQLNNGLISNPGADLSLLTLQAYPQFSLLNDGLRIGANGGLFYNKGAEGLYGANAKIRLKNFRAADFITFGGIYLGLGHTWVTDDSRIMSSSIYVDLASWFGASFEYGRDYHYDRNWYSLGITYNIGPKEKTGEPDIIEPEPTK